MANITPNQKKTFHLTVTMRTGQMRREQHQSPESRQPRTWLQRLGVVTAGLVFLPIAFFSFAIFAGLFLSMAIAITAYGLYLRSKLKRMQSRHVVHSKVISDEDDHDQLT